MNIIQNLVSENKSPIKCPYEMVGKFIIVHNTANDASAKNEINYMISNNNEVSFHYAIDDKEIVQGVPENRNTWNCGDGSGINSGNRNGISIEICYSLSGGDRFIKAERLAAQFIAEKLKENNWGIDKVKKHQDFNGKYCPHRTLDMGWQRFLDIIQSYMNNTPISSDTYIVQKGDTLSKIANKFNTSVSEILKINPNITNPNIINIGQIINITTSKTSSDIPTQSSTNVNTAAKWDYNYDSQIKDLQQILNLKGFNLSVDGIAGENTLSACKEYTIEYGDKGTLTKWVQQRLNSMGFNCGTVDGIAGTNTMSGIAKFQQVNGLGQGYLGGGDWYYLIR